MRRACDEQVRPQQAPTRCAIWLDLRWRCCVGGGLVMTSDPRGAVIQDAARAAEHDEVALILGAEALAAAVMDAQVRAMAFFHRTPLAGARERGGARAQP